MEPNRSMVLIAHNVRSCHNVGSLLRTADGLGVHHVYLTGYTPHPGTPSDARLPHEVIKITRQIHKTALGAEISQAWSFSDNIFSVVKELRRQGYHIAAIEQAPESTKLPEYKAPQKLALVLGREVEGLEQEVLALCDEILEIPMFGQKESFNVVQAAAIALYHCTFL